MQKTYLMNLLPINKCLPTVIDLFSGCGGLAFGFRAAGFEIGGGMDMSSSATATAAYNLNWRFGNADSHVCGDVTQANGSMFRTKVKQDVIVIGGPPCQAYSQVGRGKLRSLGKDREYTNDTRGQLYNDFLRVALELDARAIVMENVPEAINYGGLNVPEEICRTLDEKGYYAKWSILNAADYGVPQLRERLFIIALKKNEGKEPSFPVPTHRSMDGRVTIYKQRMQKLIMNEYFSPQVDPTDDALPWVTVYDALSDLPSLFPSSTARYRLFGPNLLLKYSSAPINGYQSTMREWSGFSMNQVSGHGYRRTVRDYPIFERMKPDDNFIMAAEISEEMLLKACGAEGITEASHPEQYHQMRKRIVPPYDREQFQEKWRRLNPDKPSHTLVAHLSVDTYSHIHPWEPRGISVREAARLQSFPDDFLFQCSMGDAFRQIGNAVPPLLSNAVATHLLQYF